MANPGLERVEINYYTVSIGALTGGSAPDDGHVDFTTPEQYGASSAFPTTDALALTKERANMRWEAILRELGTEIQPLQISSAVATTADEDTEATAVDFTVAYDKVEYVRTEDTEDNPGTFLEGTAAIKRWVERALITDHTFVRQIYKPEDHILGSFVAPQTTGTGKAGVDYGPSIVSVTAGAPEASLPIATITVTAVADVTDTI